MNIVTMFGFDGSHDFGEYWNMKSLLMTDGKWLQQLSWSFRSGELIILGFGPICHLSTFVSQKPQHLG